MKIPKHLAIIMDGNGRWAQSRVHPRTYGHIKGTRVAKTIITECSRLGVKHLTLYAFSTENWFRPSIEIQLLMNLLRKYLKRETKNLIKENIRFTTIGDTDRLPVDVLSAIESAKAATAHCSGLHLVFALSYGSRQEITSAVKNLCSQIEHGLLKASDINEALINSHLSTEGPDPDLIIRTSGEKRLSNFLLWQAAYAELYFTDILWPDFKVQDLHLAFEDYSQRERRFGKVVAPNESLRH